MTNRHVVPGSLAATITGVYGPAAAPWLAGIADTIAGCEREWNIEVGEPFPGLSFNFVLHAAGAAGTPLVLKLGFPSQEIACEMHALRAYNANGAVRLVESDPSIAALLLERVEPGDTLLTVADDAEATRIAASVMRQICVAQPSGTSFPSVADWGLGFERMRKKFDGGCGPMPEAIVSRAESLFAELVSSSESPILLHGDLHHGNILRSHDGWLTIDPKGVIGEPAYEVGSFMRNWAPGMLPTPDPVAHFARRLDIFADELDLPRERLRDWTFAQAVLSAWWCIEDGWTSGWKPTIELAELAQNA